nr:MULTISPECIES: hypothetical protein [unclassified Roseofilum]
MNELSIIQKTYDLIKWYVPILNRLPRTHKFLLGDRMIAGLYDLHNLWYNVRRLQLSFTSWKKHRITDFTQPLNKSRYYDEL